MENPDFSEALCRLIQEAIPALEAVEVLLTLSRNAEAALSPEQIASLMAPAVLTQVQAAKYLETFRLHGLVSSQAGVFRYRPSSPDLDTLVQQLARAYNERPVTLVRLIYAFQDAKIRSFADAFKIRKE